MTGTTEYMCWSTMKQRCSNPKCVAWEDHRGRGIPGGSEWHESFAAFYADMGRSRGPESFIDRIEVNGNREPGNRANQRLSVRA